MLVKAGWLVGARATMPGVWGHCHAHSGGGRRQRELSCAPVRTSAGRAGKDRKVWDLWKAVQTHQHGAGVGWGGVGWSGLLGEEKKSSQRKLWKTSLCHKKE